MVYPGSAKRGGTKENRTEPCCLRTKCSQSQRAYSDILIIYCVQMNILSGLSFFCGNKTAIYYCSKIFNTNSLMFYSLFSSFISFYSFFFVSLCTLYITLWDNAFVVVVVVISKYVVYYHD